MISYAAVTFLAAFLLFLVQPLLAKAVLPWFGGSASVWTTSLVFYQTMLLGGYLYAHLSRRVGLRAQATLHVAVLLATLLALPILPDPSWKPGGAEDPALHLLALLTVCVGAPYLLLATTSPLLHDWFARSFPGRSPYVLYSVSNTGSLLALLAYPFVVEPLWAVDAQASGWSWTYVLFVLGMGWIALATVRKAAGSDREAGVSLSADSSQPAPAPGPVTSPAHPGAPDPTPGTFVLWFLLAACGSGLLLAITNQMTLDVASVPFLWVMPLAVYLVTFILAFSGLYSRVAFGALLAFGLGIEALLEAGDASVPILLQLMGGAGVLFAACMVCHGELARSAPEPKHLTAFYLTMAGGGAAGGAAVSLGAPLLLTDFWELAAFLLLAWFLLGVVMWTDPASRMRAGGRPWAWRGLLLVGVVAGAGFVLPVVSRDGGTLARERNFYGVLHVLDGTSPEAGRIRGLRHGRILHGSQLQGSGRLGVATTYYGSGSGAHEAIRQHPRRATGPLRIGIVGEGAGTLAVWAQAGDTVRFYEIDPAVIDLARRYFTFIDDSPATVEVVLGDGRLSLERNLEPGGAGHRYDVLVIDAFSGDAIPTHLLSVEAADLYWAHLETDGVLAFNVTNRHLNLAPVIRGLAAHTGHRVVRVERQADAAFDIAFSRWLLVTRDPAPFLAADGATPEPPEPSRRWTDRFSNLLHVLR